MTKSEIINAGLETMRGFGFTTATIAHISDKDAAQAILDALDGETEDETLLDLLRSI